MGTREEAVLVQHLTGDSFVIGIRGHRVVVDQPTDSGGDDLGPTPTELFVGSLAACVGFYAERFLRRHGLPYEGLAVRAAFAMSEDRPARVSAVDLDVVLPAPLPEERRIPFRRVIDHCTVHNSIRIEPEVRTHVVEPEEAAVA